MFDCLDFLYNVLMTYNAIFSIEHYLILTLLSKENPDHVLNVLVEHLEKECKALNEVRDELLRCAPGVEGVFNAFIKNVDDGLKAFNDVEFTSFLINKPDEAFKAVRRYMHRHIAAYNSFMRFIEDFVLGRMGEGLY